MRRGNWQLLASPRCHPAKKEVIFKERKTEQEKWVKADMNEVIPNNNRNNISKKRDCATLRVKKCMREKEAVSN